MKFFLISGDGIGAGETRLSKLIAHDTWSFANAMRQELTYRYPNYNWYNKTQEYKDRVIVEEWPTTATVRQVMLEYGQSRCKDDPGYWAHKMVDYLKGRYFIADGVSIIGIDDCRKICEREIIMNAFPGKVTHFHIENDRAIKEPEFENEKLKEVANYIVRW